MIVEVTVTGGETLDLGTPSVLFEAPGVVWTSPVRAYDITPDGDLVMIKFSEPAEPVTQIEVVLKWFDELKRLVPTEP